MILAGDIGGTKTRIARFEREKGRLRQRAEESFLSAEFGGLEEILRRFVARHPEPIERASFGVAGPVRDGRCETTNLPWVIDARDLASVLHLSSAGLINDLEANAHGLAELGPSDLRVLLPGSPDASGHSAIISAGTGLGEAGLFWDGRRHRPFASEGGHADFAPRSEIEEELGGYLRKRFSRVSWERILSGPGLVNIYSFLRDSGRGEEPDWLREEMQRSDPAAVITSVAAQGRSALCAQTLDLFVSLYGAEAGNVGLSYMATAGVYIGGGIAPKIADRLADGAFVRAFVSKGRMRSLLEAMPVKIVLNERTALLGAARHASED